MMTTDDDLPQRLAKLKDDAACMMDRLRPAFDRLAQTAPSLRPQVARRCGEVESLAQAVADAADAALSVGGGPALGAAIARAADAAAAFREAAADCARWADGLTPPASIEGVFDEADAKVGRSVALLADLEEKRHQAIDPESRATFARRRDALLLQTAAFVAATKVNRERADSIASAIATMSTGRTPAPEATVIPFAPAKEAKPR